MRPLNRDTLPHLLRCAVQHGREWFDQRLARLLARWWGVRLGSSCTFCGLPYFRRTPGSRIDIGSGCRMLSRFASNLHGLNRPCMFSTVSEEAHLEVGARSGFSGTIVVCSTRVSIGARTFCGANTTITDTDSHSVDHRERHPDYFGLRTAGWQEHVGRAPVNIGEDVFLGMNVLVLKGVTIGDGTVVGAGSVVSVSLPGGVIAAGVPARPIRSLPGARGFAACAGGGSREH